MTPEQAERLIAILECLSPAPELGLMDTLPDQPTYLWSSWNDPSSLSTQEVVEGVLDWLSVVLKQSRQTVALFDF